MESAPYRKEPDRNYQPPEYDVTLDATAYNPTNTVWTISTTGGTKDFNFAEIMGWGLDLGLVNSLKGVIAARLRSYPLSSCFKLYQDLRHLMRHIADNYPSIKKIRMLHLQSYQSSLSEYRYYQATNVNTWIRYWADLDLPGLSMDAGRYAEAAPKYSNKTGQAVRTSCPIHGPYTNLEFHGLHKALHAKYASNQITLYNYALCILTSAMATRPAQLAQLKVVDFKIHISEETGLKIYTLEVPRVKQRMKMARSEFSTRALNQDIGSILEAHVVAIRAAALPVDLVAEELPLFSAANRGQKSSGLQQHTNPNNIGRRIADTFENLGVRSERTGKTINATATRSRRTLGTRLAQNGEPLSVIAHILDHSDMQSAMKYIAARNEMIVRLDKKFAMRLAPLALRFRGIILRDATDTKNDVQVHIFGAVRGGEAPRDMGGCGKCSRCKLDKPIACYTCIYFRPWRDGPHEAMLEYLLARREEQAKFDIQISETLDDTIVAVASVVQQCRQMRQADRQIQRG